MKIRSRRTPAGKRRRRTADILKAETGFGKKAVGKEGFHMRGSGKIEDGFPRRVDAGNVRELASIYCGKASECGAEASRRGFFAELRNPTGPLAGLIEPWNGSESDFREMMDELSGPLTRKNLGAFYTPPAYARLAAELVRKAMDRIPEGNDAVIIDRCAGTGNLEAFLDDDALSRVIACAYELSEWKALRDRLGDKIRLLLPKAGPDGLPEADENGFLIGADALSRDLIDDPHMRRYLDDPNCSVILLENPPYSEPQGMERLKSGGGRADWKDGFVASEMRREVSAAARGDTANAFIWSGFRYFLRRPEDSYVVISPMKYWKSQKLISKRFVAGYAFNKARFHAKTGSCLMCALWANEDWDGGELILDAYDVGADGAPVPEGKVSVKRLNSLFSEKYYDRRKDPSDSEDGIAVAFDGTEVGDGKISVRKLYNPNIVGYLRAGGSGFDNPDLQSSLLTAGCWNGHGFFLRRDSFLEKLPMFCASRYVRYFSHWTEKGRIMKSADGAERFAADVSSGKADGFLRSCLIFTCFERQNHCRSLYGSDGRLRLNELCFDGSGGRRTAAAEALEAFSEKGFGFSDEEKGCSGRGRGFSKRRGRRKDTTRGSPTGRIR